MAWTYLVASAETLSLCEDWLEPSRIVSVTPTLDLSSYHEWATDQSQPLQSGTTLRLYEGQCSTSPSTSSSAGSLARTFRVQDAERAWQESEAAYFSRSCGWPKKSSPNFCSLKMLLQLEQEDWIKWSGNFPPSGMIVDGECFPLSMWGHRTKEKDGSVWLTPRASESGEKSETFVKRTGDRGGHCFGSLSAQVKMWPTPMSSDWKQNGSPAELERNTPSLGAQICRGTGQLNPQFVEWLMGFPIEWTVLSAWAMPSCRSKREKRSKG